MNLNNVISVALVLAAVISGFGLTIRKAEKDELPETQDLAGMTEVRSNTARHQSRKR